VDFIGRLTKSPDKFVEAELEEWLKVPVPTDRDETNR
jgi:hypothetical protein